MTRPFTIQKLTERIYWLDLMGYSSTVVVGAQEVMVIDAPRDGRAAAMIRAIREELTDLPITTLVYSHYHFDHVGGANAYIEEAERTGIQLNIVGTRSSKRQIERVLVGYEAHCASLVSTIKKTRVRPPKVKRIEDMIDLAITSREIQTALNLPEMAWNRRIRKFLVTEILAERLKNEKPALLKTLKKLPAEITDTFVR